MSTEEQPQATPAADATAPTADVAYALGKTDAAPDYWAAYRDRKTDEIINALFCGFTDARLGERTREIVARQVDGIMREMTVHLLAPHA